MCDVLRFSHTISLCALSCNTMSSPFVVCNSDIYNIPPTQEMLLSADETNVSFSGINLENSKQMQIFYYNSSGRAFCK